MILVIVESPNKVEKIGSVLGSGYLVKASYGHVRDLPADHGLAITFADGRIEPEYVVNAQKSKAIAALKAAAKAADEIYLATDPDREGEAIAWHLTQVLGRHRYRRVTFHALTRDDIQAAIAAPRDLDVHLVGAQQARRVLDRVVGWAVSPTCKAGSGDPQAISAGRVQSVALRIIVDREREIAGFVPVPYQVLLATLRKPGEPPDFKARIIRWQTNTIPNGIRAPALAASILEACRAGAWVVSGVESGQKVRRPPAPFTTATCQQALSVKLGLSPAESMKLLQELFEQGAITYHRTDSVTLSPEAIHLARNWISSNLPPTYLPSQPNVFTAKSANTQEAHEAIRPTHPESGPGGLGDDLRGQAYLVIWERFIASQMAPAVDLVTTIDVLAAQDRATFRVIGRQVEFDGWRHLGDDATDETPGTDEEPADALLPDVAVGDRLELVDLVGDQRKTKAPSRFTQASLVKKLDVDGIGRPSTYAAILATLFQRKYIVEDRKKIGATPTGIALIDFLVRAYAGNFIEHRFTADMEAVLDQIASGSVPWEATITQTCQDLVAIARRAGLTYDPLAGEVGTPAPATSYPRPERLQPCKRCKANIGFHALPGDKWAIIDPDGKPHRCRRRR